MWLKGYGGTDQTQAPQGNVANNAIKHSALIEIEVMFLKMTVAQVIRLTCILKERQ